MTILSRGKSWLVSVGSGDSRVRLTVKSYEIAQAEEARLLAEQAASQLKRLQAAQLGDSTKTMQDAYDRALREEWRESKGVRTTTLNARDMVALLGADTPVTEIDSDAIDEALEALDERGLSGATVNRKIAVLNVMLRVAVEAKWLSKTPRIKRRKENRGRPFFFEHSEERCMMDACTAMGLHDLADYITFAIDTGFRRSEMLRLRVDDCTNDIISLSETKNGSPRSLPQTASTRRVIGKARAFGHERVFQNLSNSTLRTQWDAMCDYLGTEDNPKYIVHVLRHTTATRLAIGGASAAQIMAFMGHKAIQTSMRYIHMNTEHLKGVAAILERPEAQRPTLKVVNGGAA